MYIKKLLLSCTFFFTALIIFYIYTWQSPSLYNKDDRLSIHESIYTSPYHTSHEIYSCKTHFIVNFTSNTAFKSINESFPAIHIKTSDEHNGWIQVVYTDSKEESLKFFLDASKEAYPFYTYNTDFYDAPLWGHTLLSKPLSYWKAHTYAIKITDNTIKPLGGVEWGFTLPVLSKSPRALKVKPLDIKAWEKDINNLKLKDIYI